MAWDESYLFTTSGTIVHIGSSGNNALLIISASVPSSVVAGENIRVRGSDEYDGVWQVVDTSPAPSITISAPFGETESPAIGKWYATGHKMSVETVDVSGPDVIDTVEALGTPAFNKEYISRIPINLEAPYYSGNIFSISSPGDGTQVITDSAGIGDDETAVGHLELGDAVKLVGVPPYDGTYYVISIPTAQQFVIKSPIDYGDVDGDTGYVSNTGFYYVYGEYSFTTTESSFYRKEDWNTTSRTFASTTKWDDDLGAFWKENLIKE